MPTPDPAAILDWYAAHQRDLPWRRPGATPWAILVSEVMLQQTPVSRVLPVYAAWLARWPARPRWPRRPRVTRSGSGGGWAIHAGRSGCT